MNSIIFKYLISKIEFLLKLLFIITIILAQIVLSENIFGQSPVCGTKDYTPEEMQRLSDEFNQWLAQGNEIILNTVVPIPVAFHIIRKDNGSGDVTDQQINYQINALNSGFENTNFQFVLHSIERVNNSNWAIQANPGTQAEIDMKQTLAVDPKHTLNFYVVVSLATAYYGYARFPWEYSEDSYMHGVVVLNTTLPGGSDPYYNQGDNGVHEVGHYVGLYHTFQNGCQGDGDYVNDTPYEANQTPRDQCPASKISCGTEDPIHNFMDLSSDECRYEFTEGQSTRMDEQMSSLRPSIYPVNVTVDQQREDGSRLSNTYIGRWNGSYFIDNSITINPITFPFTVGLNEILRGDQNLVTNPNEKYYQWFIGNTLESNVENHHVFYFDGYFNLLTSKFKQTYSGVTIKNEFPEIPGLNPPNDKINFKDPWYIDYKDPEYGLNIRNRGMQASGNGALIFRERSSPFYPNNSTVYQNGNDPAHEYLGVFLNQPYTGNNPVYYSVQAVSPQLITLDPPIGTKNFYFQNWSGTNVSFQNSISASTAVVFNNSDATVKANMKGQGLSIDPNTFLKGGERKVVQTPGLGSSSTLHRVYQNMGYVWYETSTDDGQNWNLSNGEQFLGVGGGKNPAVDWAYMGNTGITYVAVVFQHPHPDPGHGYDIVFNLYGQQSFGENMGSFELLDEREIYSDFTSSTFEANPVVAISPYNQTATLSIVWQTSSGLYFYAAYVDEDPSSSQLILPVKPPELIPDTDENSINPTLGVTKINYNTTFGLAWEENNTIKYRTISTSSYGSINTISNYDGYTYNNNPSLVMLSDNYARVCWRASRFISQIDPITKTDNSYWDIRTIFRGSNYNHFWYFGYDVGNPNINKSDPEDYYAIIWNQDENLTFFADNHLNATYSINDFPGSRVRVTNGPDENHMYADVLNTQSLPYYFKTSGSLGSYYYPSKVTGYTFASGREGVIAKDTAQFYFAVGDVKVDDDGIDFITIPDSVEFTSNEILNTYLVSEPFQLTDNSTFLYSIQYGITDSSAAANLLSNSDKYINFKLQLIDEQTSEVLGTYDDVTFDQSNIYQYNNLSYQVNTEGIGTRTAYLRLVTDNNFDAGYSLAEIYSAGDVLQKTTVKTARYNGLETVTTYDLSQNFPNPFNPATTINYQLPQTGHVTLKVYDILGKEVATLVNEQKNQGRYSVNLDGSRLASGVYIYRLSVNDYVRTKKMLLLK